jgi:hypothetical protein
MTQVAEAPSAPFIDRRSYADLSLPPTVERRQFTNNYDELSPEAREFALAVDGYKMRHRRRFITYEEMLAIVCSLGYRRA